MTSPTGPDRDRLRASDAGQETCQCGHPVTDHDTDRFSDEGCLHGWGPGLVRFDAAGCMCKRYRPAPQQPPAQERECAVCLGHGVDCPGEPGCQRPAPPSEADSAGEVARFAAVLRWHLPDRAQDSGCAMRCGYDGDGLDEHLALALAASSGVRGGDYQARERLADVLALHVPIHEYGDPADRKVCRECSGFDAQPWPCPTVRAAGGAR